MVGRIHWHYRSVGPIPAEGSAYASRKRGKNACKEVHGELPAPYRARAYSVALRSLNIAVGFGAEGDRASLVGPLSSSGVLVSAFPKPARLVAPSVSDKWSTEEARDRDGEADQVMRFLGVGPGMTVADIEAAEGYYTVRLARRIGSTGRVIAEWLALQPPTGAPGEGSGRGN
jgi:hypothetical protein